MRQTVWMLSLSAFAFAGCGREETRDRTPASETPGGMAGMHGDSMAMGGMQHGMQRTQMMAMMRAHMDSMMRMSPDQMRAMMANHDRAMSGMLDAMGADMRSMNMTGDSTWNALTDSVKRDLAEMPDVQGPELSARMRAHAERVRRLMSMHEGMMSEPAKQ